MVTIYITGDLVSGSPGIDVPGSGTLGDMQELIATELGVPAASFEMLFEGCLLDDLAVQVSKSLLCEGSTVEVRPSKAFEAKKRLKKMGMTCRSRDLCRVLCSNKSEKAKVEVTRLMLDCGMDFDVRLAMCHAAAKGHCEVIRLLAPKHDFTTENAPHPWHDDGYDDEAHEAFCTTSDSDSEEEDEEEECEEEEDEEEEEEESEGVDTDSLSLPMDEGCRIRTPLYVAAKRGQLEAVNLLVSLGSSPSGGSDFRMCSTHRRHHRHTPLRCRA